MREMDQLLTDFEFGEGFGSFAGHDVKLNFETSERWRTRKSRCNKLQPCTAVENKMGVKEEVER